MKEAIELKNMETKTIAHILQEEEKDLYLIKDEIRKMNKKITDTNVFVFLFNSNCRKRRII
jgi:hypothetical protein